MLQYSNNYLTEKCSCEKTHLVHATLYAFEEYMYLTTEILLILLIQYITTPSFTLRLSHHIHIIVTALIVFYNKIDRKNKTLLYIPNLKKKIVP